MQSQNNSSAINFSTEHILKNLTDKLSICISDNGSDIEIYYEYKDTGERADNIGLVSAYKMNSSYKSHPVYMIENAFTEYGLGRSLYIVLMSYINRKYGAYLTYNPLEQTKYSKNMWTKFTDQPPKGVTEIDYIIVNSKNNLKYKIFLMKITDTSIIDDLINVGALKIG